MEPVDLVIAGTIKDAANCDVDLLVSLETVVPDHEVPEILTMYSTRTHTDGVGRYADRYDVPDEVRRDLRGWVMCTVVLQPQVRGARSFTKVVRWQRQSSNELITGLSALLASVSFEPGLSHADRPRHGGAATTRRFV
jgi:hypothetical protein